MKIALTIISIVFRILVFPFFIGMATIGALHLWVRWIIFFIRYGGEAIAYSDKMSKKTIQDVYMKLVEQQEKVKEG